jgi:hypothetical protein
VDVLDYMAVRGNGEWLAQVCVRAFFCCHADVAVVRTNPSFSFCIAGLLSSSLNTAKPHVSATSYAEWAKLVYSWVDASGQMGNVFTLYELLEGDETTKVRECAFVSLSLTLLYDRKSFTASNRH